MKPKRKICTHCGRETHAQPQDWDHDLGYGHCYDCLNKEDFYVPYTFSILPEVTVNIYVHRNYIRAHLTTDDSEPKVVEVIEYDKVTGHFTSHKTKSEILAKIRSRFVI